MRCIIHGLLLLGMLVSNVAAEQANPQTASSAPKKANYAVINLKCGSGVTEGDGELISDRLRAELFNTGNVNVMERNQMQDILKEQGFQQSGATCTDEACLVEMGQLLGVQYLIAGSLGKLGSMYMVNIRSIDVQTGKITSAVSVDIKGDIEDLVEKLPDIALKLTGAEKKTQAPQPPEVKEPQPVKEVEPQPEIDTAKTVEQEVSEKEEEEQKVVEKNEVPSGSSRNAKNKNRSGIGLFFTLSGKPEIMLDDSKADTLFTYNIFDTNDWYWDISDYEVKKSNTLNFGLRFYIRTGSFFNIEIGPALTLASENYKYYSESYDADLNAYTYSKIGLEINYMVPAVHLGFDFVKRWFPLKMNIGIFANFSFPVTTFTFTRDLGYSGYSPTYSDSDDGYDFDFSVAFGSRCGAEIMAGPYVGFSLDFVFNYLRWETAFDFANGSGLTEPDRNHEIFLPMFGLGLGVNFYF